MVWFHNENGLIFFSGFPGCCFYVFSYAFSDVILICLQSFKANSCIIIHHLIIVLLWLKPKTHFVREIHTNPFASCGVRSPIGFHIFERDLHERILSHVGRRVGPMLDPTRPNQASLGAVQARVGVWVSTNCGLLDLITWMGLTLGCSSPNRIQYWLYI